MAANLTWTKEAHSGRNIFVAVSNGCLLIVHENTAAGVIRVSIGSVDPEGRAIPIQFQDKFATVDEAKAALVAAVSDELDERADATAEFLLKQEAVADFEFDGSDVYIYLAPGFQMDGNSYGFPCAISDVSEIMTNRVSAIAN